MKATVDQETCIACGKCSEICPAVFQPDEDEKSTVIVDPIPAESEACAQEAADECPVEAITIE